MAQRSINARTVFFTLARNNRRGFVLDQKPDLLKHLDTVDQAAWEQYETHLSRVSPLERAESYRGLMEQMGLKSICALARVVGKDESGIRQYLNLLKLPAPIQQFLKENRTPAYLRYFSEKRLRDLLKIGDPRLAWQRFRNMLADARSEAGIWSQFEQ
ncbi:MAG: hypothetical protein HYY16_14215 [Planctomycetes bacterium]|nr:hypothetical protein [Planctomycetota bacterium]